MKTKHSPLKVVYSAKLAPHRFALADFNSVKFSFLNKLDPPL